MSGTMTEPNNVSPEGTKRPRVRLIIDTEADLVAALKLRAAKESVRQGGEEVSKSDVVNEILRAALAPELRERASKRKS